LHLWLIEHLILDSCKRFGGFYIIQLVIVFRQKNDMAREKRL